MNHIAVTHKGLLVIAWCLVFGLGATLVARALGLEYLQGVIWPTDLNTFSRLPTAEPIDVAVLGSSRASFGLPPSALDACLSQRLGRSTRSVNLARAFATTPTFLDQAEELLEGERTPEVLLLAIGPEALDPHNHQNAAMMAQQADLEDIPSSILQVRTLNEAFASLRPLFRGSENLAILLSGRHRSEQRLRWMMTFHGGGQYCYGSTFCDRNNHDVETVLAEQWDEAERRILPNLAAERFSDYAAGTGRADRATQQLVAWARANDVTLAIVNLPLHNQFMGAMPEGVYERYRAVLDDVVTRHELPLYDANTVQRRLRRTDYVDADHLSAVAARQLAEDVCAELLLPLLQDD